MRHLPVVDASGRLVGMISDRDLRGPRRRAGEAAAPEPHAAVATVMSGSPITAAPDADLAVIARMMVDASIGAIAIVDESGEPVGIVSYVDVLGRMAEDREHAAASLDVMDIAEIVPRPPPDMDHDHGGHPIGYAEPPEPRRR